MALAKGTRGTGEPTPRAPKKKKSRPSAAPPVFGSRAATRSVERPGSSSRVTNPSSLRSYPFIRVNSGVDFRNVQPTLLQRLNFIGKKLGRVVTLTSGYRTHSEQRYLYNQYLAGNIGLAAPPGRSNHEHGRAVDALIDGEAIGNVIPENVLNQLGLHSLAHVGDAVHVELAEGVEGATSPQGGAPQQVSMTAPPEVPVSAAPPPAQGAQAGTIPPREFEGVMSQEPILPYELGSEAPILNPIQRAETWQLIASQPGASPETQQLARFASMSIGG